MKKNVTTAYFTLLVLAGIGLTIPQTSEASCGFARFGNCNNQASHQSISHGDAIAPVWNGGHDSWGNNWNNGWNNNGWNNNGWNNNGWNNNGWNNNHTVYQGSDYGVQSYSSNVNTYTPHTYDYYEYYDNNDYYYYY